MQTQEAIDARRAAEATRRGGGDDAETLPKPSASSSSGAIGHINNEEGRAALAPIKENGSAGSAPVPVVAFTIKHVRRGVSDCNYNPVFSDYDSYGFEHVRQGDKVTEDGRQGNIKVRQGDDSTEDRRQGNINITNPKKDKGRVRHRQERH